MASESNDNNKDNNMTNPVDAAIQVAKEAHEAKQAEAAKNQSVETYTPQPAAAYQAPRLMTFDDLSGSNLDVDDFIQVNEFGLGVKKQKLLGSKFRASINTQLGTGIQVATAIRYGNPSVYAKTYDNVKAVQGGSWQEVLNKANLVDPKATPYTSADLNFTLIEDMLAHDGKTVLAEKGTTLGYSTSATGRANVKAFTDEVARLGLTGEVVEVEVTSEPRVNKTGDQWGVLKFQLIGAFNAA